MLPRSRASPNFSLFSIIITLMMTFLIGLALPAPGQAAVKSSHIADFEALIPQVPAAMLPALNNSGDGLIEALGNYLPAIYESNSTLESQYAQAYENRYSLILETENKDMQISALMICNKGDPTYLTDHIIADAKIILFGGQGLVATSETEGYANKFIL